MAIQEKKSNYTIFFNPELRNQKPRRTWTGVGKTFEDAFQIELDRAVLSSDDDLPGYLARIHVFCAINDYFQKYPERNINIRTISNESGIDEDKLRGTIIGLAAQYDFFQQITVNRPAYLREIRSRNGSED